MERNQAEHENKQKGLLNERVPISYEMVRPDQVFRELEHSRPLKAFEVAEYCSFNYNLDADGLICPIEVRISGIVLRNLSPEKIDQIAKKLGDNAKLGDILEALELVQ